MSTDKQRSRIWSPPDANLNACSAALCYLMCHCHAHKRPQLNAALSQLNPVNILTTCFFETRCRGRSEGECLQYVLAAVVFSSRSSVSVYQRENRWINVHEIWHWGTLLKFVDTSQLRPKSEQQNFIWMPRLLASSYQRQVTVGAEQSMERRKVFFKTRLILRMFKFQTLQ